MHAGKPIYWHEGLFLRPQHFQQLDDYCNHTIQSRFQYGDPYQWGIKLLRFMQGTVANEIIEIVDLDLLFKDGTHVQYPGNCRIARRNISELWDGNGKPMSIYLALKNRELGRNNVEMESESPTAFSSNGKKFKNGRENLNTLSVGKMESTRYFLSDQGVDVADHYSDDKYHRLLFLEYQLQIFVGSEADSATDYHLIKIAELTKTTGDVRISTEYIPPLIHVSSSKRMVDLLRGNSEQVASIIRKLSIQVAGKQVSRAAQDSTALNSLMILQTLNRYFPLLQQLLKGPNSRPYDVYMYMRQLVSELSTFSSRAHVEENEYVDDSHVLEFQHDSLYQVFKNISRQLTLLLQEIISIPETVLPMKFDGTYYSTRINDWEVYKTASVYIAVSTTMDKEKIIHLIECLSKVSSREHLPLLISRSISSSDLDYQVEPDYRLERCAGMYYFKLNKSGLVWESIKGDKNIAVYLNSETDKLEMKLVALHD